MATGNLSFGGLEHVQVLLVGEAFEPRHTSFISFSAAPWAKADPIINDPFFNVTMGNSCPSNCMSFGQATDPLSGIKTFEYVFYNAGDVTAGHAAISAIDSGDVKVDDFGTTTLGDLIRFENIGGSAVAFIFSAADSRRLSKVTS